MCLSLTANIIKNFQAQSDAGEEHGERGGRRTEGGQKRGGDELRHPQRQERVQPRALPQHIREHSRREHVRRALRGGRKGRLDLRTGTRGSPQRKRGYHKRGGGAMITDDTAASKQAKMSRGRVDGSRAFENCTPCK